MAPSNNSRVDINVVLSQTVEKLKSETSKMKTDDLSAVKNINSLLESLQKLAKVAKTDADLDNFTSKLNKLAKVVKEVEGEKTSKVLLELMTLKESKETTKSKKVSRISTLKTDQSTAKQNFVKAFTDANLKYVSGPNTGKKVSLDALTKNPERAFSKMKPEDVEQAKLLIEKHKELKEEEAKTTETIKKLNAEVETLTAEISNLKTKIKDEKNKNPGSESTVLENVDNIVSDTKQVIENQQLSKAEEKAKVANLSLDELDKQDQVSGLGKAFKQFSIYAVAVRTLKKAVREAVNTIKELDSSLTEQAMVTGKTRAQTYKLLSTYQDLAKQTGATTKEIAELSTQFIRQGKSTNEALVLTTAAMDAAKVANISASDSINYLTTALNGFQLSANDSMKVSDKFAAVSANAATSYDEIATALSKVASQANLAGMSIDYTTALLAKGLETTREAPETIGTALKTVIARMREISDYGETLSGDTDVNNVESQLAYIGIALRDANGELRSTEEVLDDLGKKWDTLNSNQQAAVAKALAGTRQQSRLIAMMTDYERVIELQQISERSSGATLSQMSTYLQGMDAALNRVNVSYEKLITAFANNEAIIAITNAIGTVLDGLAWFMDSIPGSIVVFTTLGTLALSALGNKLKELSISKYINKQELEKQKIQTETNIQKLKELKTLKEQTIEKAQQVLLDEKASDDQKEEARAIIKETEAEIIQNDELIEKYKYKLDLLKGEDSIISRISSGLGGNLIIINGIISGYKKMSRWLTAIRAKSKKNNAEEIAEEEAKNGVLAKNSLLKALADAGFKGLAIAIPIVATLAVGGLAIAGIIKFSNDQKKQAGSVAKSVNSLSNEIYKLNEKSQNLKTIIKNYEEIDKAIIKTKADQEELNSLLEQASDKLSEEEKANYNNLSNNKKFDYLKQIEKAAEEQANKDRQKQLKYINKLSASQRAKLLSEDTTDTNFINAQQALYAINNKTLYDFMDNILSKTGDFTSEELTAIESLTQAMLEGVDPTKAYWYAQNPDQINEIAKSISKLTVNYDGLNKKVAEVLTSEDYNIYEKVKAYREAIKSLDQEQQNLLKEIYPDMKIMNKFSDTMLEYIVNTGISSKSINDMGKALNELGYETEDAAKKIEELFQTISSTNGDIKKSIKTTFKDILSIYNEGTKEWTNIYNKILNSYSDAVAVGVLNMGQNVQSLKKTINSFYEKASNWSTLSDTEKTEFLTDNINLFEGNEQLYNALVSGDYNTMYQALTGEKTLTNKVAEQIKKIKAEIDIEEASLKPNKAYIAYLNEQLELLQDTDNFYKASLEFRLQQEEKYLSEYKNYLSEQKTALQDSLNERKDAYQKYFDAINQQQEDEDFEEKESNLIANITKLSTSTSANAMNQMSKLQKELANLEEERIQTLRERAQEAIMSDIDDQLQDINDKFDDLLNSQQALLAAMTGELKNPTNFLSNLITNKSNQEGLTALGLQNYIQDLQTTYGSIVGNEVFKDITVREIGNQVILNIAGKEINLSESDQQSVYDAIMTALQQVGYR